VERTSIHSFPMGIHLVSVQTWPSNGSGQVLVASGTGLSSFIGQQALLHHVLEELGKVLLQLRLTSVHRANLAHGAFVAVLEDKGEYEGRRAVEVVELAGGRVQSDGLVVDPFDVD
jgi:hypothetical protein